MNLLADIFQKNQQIAQNPASVVRTPQQQAYDNLLNRQYDIEQQNKKYNTFNGIMSGAGGLGKIIASAFVKNPYQQAGAMEGIGQQEQRLDNLRQAYENLRNAQNKDYVAQAKEQLDMANADEEKAYNRDLTSQQIAYKKLQDEIANRLNQDKFEFAKEQFDNQKRQQEIDNKHWEIQDTYNKDKAEQDKIQRETENKFKDRALTLQENEAVNKPILEQQKAEQEQLKKNQERAFNLINSNSVTPALGNLMLNNPELMPYLKDSGKYSKPINAFGLLPWKVGGNDNKFDFNYEQYLIDNGIPVTKANIKQLKKDLGL